MNNIGKPHFCVEKYAAKIKASLESKEDVIICPKNRVPIKKYIIYTSNFFKVLIRYKFGKCCITCHELSSKIVPQHSKNK